MHYNDVNKQYICKKPANFSCDTCSTKWHETNVCTLCASNSIANPISVLATTCESDSYHAKTCSKSMDHLQLLAFNKSKKVERTTYNSDSSDSIDGSDPFNLPYIKDDVQPRKTGTNLTKAIGNSSSHTSKLVKMKDRPHVPVMTKQISPSNDIILISNKKRAREEISGQANSPSDSSINNDDLNAILNMSWTPSPLNEASN